MRNSEVIKITVRRPGLKSESYYLLAIRLEEVISPLSLFFFFFMCRMEIKNTPSLGGLLGGWDGVVHAKDKYNMQHLIRMH